MINYLSTLCFICALSLTTYSPALAEASKLPKKIFKHVSAVGVQAINKIERDQLEALPEFGLINLQNNNSQDYNGVKEIYNFRDYGIIKEIMTYDVVAFNGIPSEAHYSDNVKYINNLSLIDKNRSVSMLGVKEKLFDIEVIPSFLDSELIDKINLRIKLHTHLLNKFEVNIDQDLKLKSGQRIVIKKDLNKDKVFVFVIISYSTAL